jgi:peptidoglycan/xylan/chitin deacetylase (PgdA/CDA1 family)
VFARFVEQTRCPHSIIEGCQRQIEGEPNRLRARHRPAEERRPGQGCPGTCTSVSDGQPAFVRDFLDGEINASLLWDLNETIDSLRFERYVSPALQGTGYKNVGSITRRGYYLLRPLLPVAFRKHLQRIALKGWNKRDFPAWPVDFTTENIFEKVFGFLLQALNPPEIPFIWYWPDGYSACCLITHDVETRAGRDFCRTMMRMEARHGVASSFELVPEQRYEVPMELIEQIRESGCEVCIHGLNHGGDLFSSEEVFREQAERINEYAEKWSAIGFRSPVLYRNLDWLHALKIDYDLSVPNVGHLDPQPGGCCTVMPYFIGNILELPLTTTQDYSIYHILKQRSLGLWKEQTEKILDRHGLISFIIHPDYTTARWSKQLYESLLEYLTRLRADRGLWIALPRDVNAWWRHRRNMKLVKIDGQWRVRGPEAWRARVAYASLENGQIAYRVEAAALQKPDF